MKFGESMKQDDHWQDDRCDETNSAEPGVDVGCDDDTKSNSHDREDAQVDLDKKERHRQSSEECRVHPLPWISSLDDQEHAERNDEADRPRLIRLVCNSA